MADITITPICQPFWNFTESPPEYLFLPVDYSFNLTGLTASTTVNNPTCAILYQLQADGSNVDNPVTTPPTWSEGPTVTIGPDGNGFVSGLVQVLSPDPSLAGIGLSIAIPLDLTIIPDSGSIEAQITHSTIVQNPDSGSAIVNIGLVSDRQVTPQPPELGYQLNFPEPQNASASETQGPGEQTQGLGRKRDVTVVVPISLTPSTVPNNDNPTYLWLNFTLTLVFGQAFR